MKVMKKWTALLLCAACLCSLLTVPSAAAAPEGAFFTDVADPTVAQAVETLRVMGVIDGLPGGRFNPSGTLTRAEFCKLVILMMDRGDDVDAYATKTIFPDVSSTHWARGFINLAASESLSVGGSEGSAGVRLIQGVGDGTFAPNRTITYGEAVTILLRVLGYTAAANTNWPTGAVGTAKGIGLSEDLGTISASSGISRGQAAVLFYNMLTTPLYNSTQVYAETRGTLQRNTLILSCNTTTDDNRNPAVKLFTSVSGTASERTCKVAVNNPSPMFQGRYGTVLFDGDGLFLTFLPDKGATSKTLTTSKATAKVLTAEDGSTLELTASTKVWFNGEQRLYNEVFSRLNRPGVTVTVYYTAAGEIDYLYVGGTAVSTNSNALAAKDPISGNPFATLTGGTTGYTILKNGVRATVGDIRQYDVGVFDAAANTLYVTDFRITGTYQAATPNIAAPSKITVFGQEFEVLESAIDDLKDFKLGSSMTLLLTSDGKVAGAVSASDARTTAVGVVDPSSTSGNVKVNLLGGPENVQSVSGSFSGDLESYKGCLVLASAGPNGAIYLSQLITSAAYTTSLDVAKRTIGDVALAENVSIYERVGNSAIGAVSLSDLTVETVAGNKIVYMRKNYAGKIDLLVLNDVTGDQYTYGVARSTTRDVETTVPGLGDLPATTVTKTVTTTTITGAAGSVTVGGGTPFTANSYGGVVAALDSDPDSGNPRCSASVVLKSVKNVHLHNFNLDTNRLVYGSLEIPIAEDVQYYDEASRTWLSSLEECLAYSEALTVYYDRDPINGGKVRIIVSNPA